VVRGGDRCIWRNGGIAIMKGTWRENPSSVSVLEQEISHEVTQG
jgi:hypothetical protein